MTIYSFFQEQEIPISLKDAWEFFSDVENLLKLSPPSMAMKIADREPYHGAEGQVVKMNFKLGGVLARTWVSKIEDWNPPHSFTDIQLEGPYRYWKHQHKLVPSENGTLVKDVVEYALPRLPFTDFWEKYFIRPQLENIFDYRRQALNRLFPV